MFRVLMFFAAIILSFPAAATGMADGARLLCALSSSSQCSAGGSCVTGGPDVINLPVFLRVDLESKLITGTRQGGDTVRSSIATVNDEGNMLVLQGAENERAWSAAIDRSSGQLTATISGQGVGFIAFGACTSP